MSIVIVVSIVYPGDAYAGDVVKSLVINLMHFVNLILKTEKAHDQL